jgi:AraC family transcriptional regulator, transcriptional activator of pobA
MADSPASAARETLPLAHYAQADRIRADVAESEWRLATRRLQGRSTALVLGAGRSVTQFAQGQVSLRAPCFLWLPPGAGQAVRVAPGSEGVFLSLNEDLVARAAQGGNASAELRSTADRLIQGEGAAAAKHVPALLQAAHSIHQELREPGQGGMSLLIAQAMVILVHGWRLAGFELSEAETGWTGSTLFQRYRQAVELHFREDWPVSRYAAQLGVTERRLHAAVTRACGKSPVQILHLRILEAARARLEQSSLPIAQIGYGLGFSDPASFSRFFKKVTGLSPGAFRQRRRQENRRDTTYAAWP